jgi:hypothetical protein
MFNNRDLGILGGGALLAVLCLFLPLSFVGKVVIGFLVLVAFMALALLRLGPDRVPPETWLKRRFRYAWQTRQYVNQQTETRRSQDSDATTRKPKQKHPAFDTQTVLMPIHFAWDEVGIYPLLTALLGVVGTYFSVWLANGGAEELSIWFR